MYLTSILAGLMLYITLGSSSVIILKEQDRAMSGYGSYGGDGKGGDDGRGPCLRVCFSKKPACPKNMDPYKLGDCWSCCLRQKFDFEPQPQIQAEYQPAIVEIDLDGFADENREFL
ncbi:hypothetical protein BDV11DRAFT_180108 [Aspergillus similis]